MGSAEIQEHRGGTVHVEPLVAIDEPDDSGRGAVEDEARRVDEIAPDVHQPAAAELRMVPDVSRVFVEVAEVPEDRADLADSAAANELTRPEPLRVRSDHE